MGIVTDPELIAKLNTLHAAQSQTQKEPSFLQKAGGFAEKYINKPIESAGIPDVAGGVLQGAGDIAASLGNVIARPLGHPIPHPDLQKYTSGSPFSKAMFGAGELGAQIPAFMSGAGALGRFTGLGEDASLLAKALHGATTSAAMGENKEGGGRKLAAALGTLTGPGVLSEIPVTRRLASRHLNRARELVRERGVQSLNVPEHLLDEARTFLPQNAATENLLHQASAGNYEPLFTLQSDLAASARDLMSGRGADRMLGRQANELRQSLLNSMRGSLAESGHTDIANIMRRGQNKYRQYSRIKQNVYRPMERAGIPLGAVGITSYAIAKALEKARQ